MISPESIYQDFLHETIDRSSAIDLLMILIDNSENITIRTKSLHLLIKIGSKNEQLFNVLENLLISDSNEKIKIIAARGLRRFFLYRALPSMKHALYHEKSLNILSNVINILGEINTRPSKEILLNELKKVKYQQCERFIHQLLKDHEIDSLNGEKLAKLLLNFLIINYFENKYEKIDFSFNQGEIYELNLSSLGNNTFDLNILKNVPEFIGFLTSLKRLDLRINSLENLPDSIGSLKALNYLDLSYNKLKFIPETITTLSSLETLYLRYNNLEGLPKSMGALRSLKNLDLRANILTSLPETICEISCLKMLDLHGNQLKFLPESFENFTSLEKLELGMNCLKILPNGMKNLTRLQKLGLGGNKSLLVSPDWCFSLPSLKELELYDNDLQIIPDCIGDLTSLEILDLRNNKIFQFPDTLSQLKSLKKLNLSWNNIKSIPEWISSLKSLQELNLWGNKLEEVHESIFELRSLTELHLNYNKNNKQVSKLLDELQIKGLKIPR